MTESLEVYMRRKYSLAKMGFGTSDYEEMIPWEVDIYINWAMAEQKRQDEEISKSSP